MSRLGVVLPALTLVLAGTMSCGAATVASGDRSATAPQHRHDTVGPIDTVVAISIDGLNPRAIRRLGPGRAPTLHALMSEGASTLNARTELELTDTLPNHTGMVTGRRIEARTGGHGVTWNDDRRRPPTVAAAAGGEVPSVFDVVHDAGGGTAFFASKTKFSLWQRSWPDAIDRAVIVENNARLVRRFVRDLTVRERTLRFLHLSAPDKAGHDSGFMGRRYLRAVAATDRLLATIMDTISSTRLSGHTALVLTSDHGGRGGSHRNPRRPVNYIVPFVVWGPGVAAGADLYALNATYTDPRRTRPTYADATIRNGHVANLALDLLELPAVPDSEHGAAQDLEWTDLSARRLAATG